MGVYFVALQSIFAWRHLKNIFLLRDLIFVAVGGLA
jgi:hypothetical protein